jgi:hypothetical protein
MAYVNKTDRKRGVIWGNIRRFMRSRRTFTIPQLAAQGFLTHDQAHNNLWAMRRIGEIRVIKPGVPRHGGTIFERAR